MTGNGLKRTVTGSPPAQNIPEKALWATLGSTTNECIFPSGESAPYCARISVRNWPGYGAEEMNPNRVDFVVDLAYGVAIFVAIGLVLVVGTQVGIAFGLGVLLSYVIHIGWKMARFDPDWMTQEVAQQVEETVSTEVQSAVDDSMSQEVDEVAEQVEQAVAAEVTEKVEQTVSDTVEETVREEVEGAIESEADEP